MPGPILVFVQRLRRGEPLSIAAKNRSRLELALYAVLCKLWSVASRLHRG
jgi:hypothetical protein